MYRNKVKAHHAYYRNFDDFCTFYDQTSGFAPAKMRFFKMIIF